MAKRSKRMRAMAEKAPSEALPLAEAVKVLKSFNTTKFDQSVEIAMRLGINPAQADQMVRGSIVLPHGIGKTVRVAVFAKGTKSTKLAQLVRTSSAAPTFRRKSRPATSTSTCASPPRT